MKAEEQAVMDEACKRALELLSIQLSNPPDLHAAEKWFAEEYGVPVESVKATLGADGVISFQVKAEVEDVPLFFRIET